MKIVIAILTAVLIAVPLIGLGFILGEQSATTQCLQTMRTAR